ncbi:MAG: GNAT family N-acetyltransferase [Rhizomicrobium sp.]|jgi:ribosomal protein S18 acetylase RimI-like enzyme
MVEIRSYRAADLEALYRVCLTTGDAGRDAAALYRDSQILGHVYAGPYAACAADSAFVLQDEEGVGGYILGPANTYAFEKRLEAEWWPRLRGRYPDPAAPQTSDERMAWLIHHPPRTPRRISEPYPAHLHINLLPRFQGRGLGAALIERWLAAVGAQGAHAAHLAVGARNERAVAFYRRYGFRELERTGLPFDVIWFGIETKKDAK